MHRHTLRTRVDKQTLQGLGWINLIFCAVSVYTGAIVPAIFTLILFGGCHGWAGLEPEEDS